MNIFGLLTLRFKAKGNSSMPAKVKDPLARSVPLVGTGASAGGLAAVIPPNRDMALLDGRLHLPAPGAPRGTVGTGRLCAVPW